MSRRISFPDDLTRTQYLVSNHQAVVASSVQSSLSTTGMGGPRRRFKGCPLHTGASPPFNWTALLNVSIVRGLQIVTYIAFIHYLLVRRILIKTTLQLYYILIQPLSRLAQICASLLFFYITHVS